MKENKPVTARTPDVAHKYDGGKARLSLTPTQIIRDIAEVREYGVEKYNTVHGWKAVEMARYVDAFYRHWLAFIDDWQSVDEESGIEHYKHCACNIAFICELMEKAAPKDTGHRDKHGDPIYTGYTVMASWSAEDGSRHGVIGKVNTHDEPVWGLSVPKEDLFFPLKMKIEEGRGVEFEIVGKEGGYTVD